MNTVMNAIRKHYDKLSITERFSALVAANLRGDRSEGDALLQSAPRKHFSVPNTYGIAHAFNFLAMWHQLNLLGYTAQFYWLLLIDDEELETSVKVGDESFSISDAFSMLEERILTDLEAWRAVCKEYGIQPLVMLEGLPFQEQAEFMEAVIRGANEGEAPDLPELPEAIASLRDTIERMRKGWE